MFTNIEFVVYAIISVLIYIPNVFWRIFFQSGSLNSYKKTLHETDLSNQIVIVTGSNTGIGKDTAKKLALLGGTVVLACRDSEKAEKACEDIRKSLENVSKLLFPKARNGQVLHIPLDLASLKSVVTFVDKIKENYRKIDILVNNAGTNASRKTSDGLQQLFQINYIGHFLLTILLEPLLSYKSDKGDQSTGRIVNLSSVMHHLGKPNFYNLDYPEYSSKPTKYDYYADSKLFLNLLTMEVNRRFGSVIRSGRPIRCISSNPGAVRSDIWRHIPKYLQNSYDLFMRFFYLSCEQGSYTSIYGAIVSDNELQTFQSRHKHLQNITDQKSYKWTYHPWLPYLIPYHIYFNLLNFEILGPICGPNWSEVSLPKDANKVAVDLWEISKQLCLVKLRNDLTEVEYHSIVLQLESI